jgi:IS30 family transposase
MDLEAALSKKNVIKYKCRVAVLISSLDEKNAKALESAIKSELSPYVITRALRSEGLTLSENTIYRHRRDECQCAIK